MNSLINHSYVQLHSGNSLAFNFLLSKPFTTIDTDQPHRGNRLYCYLYNLIARTFPSEYQIEHQMNLKRLNAIKLKLQLKEISEEEILKYESTIPEWKRNAIIIVNSSPKDKPSKTKKHRLLSTLSSNPVSRLIRIIYNKSDLSVLMKDFAQSYSNLKYNLKFTGNPVIMLIRDLIEKVHFKSSVSQATEILRKHQPDFDLCTFEKEMKVVLKQMLTLYMNDDSKGLQMICGESAYAMLSTEIKARADKGVELKYKRPIYIDEPVCQSAEIIDQDNVVMKVKVTIQECPRLIDKQSKATVGKGPIESNQYVFDVIRNPVPFEEEFGHSYMVVNYQKIESATQLV